MVGTDEEVKAGERKSTFVRRGAGKYGRAEKFKNLTKQHHAAQQNAAFFTFSLSILTSSKNPPTSLR